MARSYCSQGLIEFAAVVLLGGANLPFWPIEITNENELLEPASH